MQHAAFGIEFSFESHNDCNIEFKTNEIMRGQHLPLRLRKIDNPTWLTGGTWSCLPVEEGRRYWGMS